MEIDSPEPNTTLSLFSEVVSLSLQYLPLASFTNVRVASELKGTHLLITEFGLNKFE